MKKLAWFLIALCSLILVNFGQTLWLSFEENSWTVSYYNITKPQQVLVWLMSAAVLAFAAYLATKIHYEVFVRPSASIVLGTLTGTILLVLTDVFLNSLIILQGSSLKDITDTNFEVFFRWPPLAAYAIVGFLNTLVGIWFGKPIVVPDGDIVGTKMASWPFLWLTQKIRDRKKAGEEKEEKETGEQRRSITRSWPEIKLRSRQ